MGKTLQTFFPVLGIATYNKGQGINRNLENIEIVTNPIYARSSVDFVEKI